jgi:hypothetical protein
LKMYMLLHEMAYFYTHNYILQPYDLYLLVVT